MFKHRVLVTAVLIACTAPLCAEPAVIEQVTLGPYPYETKPDHPAFALFNPAKAPVPGSLVLQHGDRLAICGDSITEQRKYSRIIETYLTACVPQLEVTVRQYGWGGEKTDGFLRRMEQDCLTFQPTVATLCYGMNDSRYRPYDATNGRWYQDHLRAIVRRFKTDGVRVVVGSPGCAGKVARWVKGRNGTVEQHNLNLCALRDIAMQVAQSEECRMADVFWPMLQAQVFAPEQHGATEDNPYEVAGADGIHPGWAGHVVMAYAFLRAMGLDGQIGEIRVDLAKGSAAGSAGHQVQMQTDGTLQITSTRYPFCATGDPHSDRTRRSGMSLVPFDEDLNRLTLTVTGTSAKRYRVTWGQASRAYDASDLAQGINLAADFIENPFCEAFFKVDDAVEDKQEYETYQVKKVFHGKLGKQDFEEAVRQTEAERAPLAAAVQQPLAPVVHTLRIEPLR